MLLGTLLLTPLLSLLPLTGPASAASSYLCTGYVGCKEAGYSHFGYRGASDRMWWRMYSGHNCTNYVAYRLVKGGMSAERPWSGTGMAWNWGRAKRSITDRKPMVGAVAWWNANAPGTGSSGHVAYVERVISDDTIVISEDSWSGDFHWRTLRRSDGRWPTGFIHFDDRAVQMKERPVISGAPAVGETLAATAGRWTPAATYAFQWLADGKPISGATSTSLRVTPGLQGRELSVRVEATKRGYVGASTASIRTARVARGTMTRTALPRITGTARVDEVLEVQEATWAPRPGTTTIQWYAGGTPIAGATGRRLRLGQELIHQKVTVRMVARTEGYKASGSNSEPTAPVAAGRIDLTTPFTLSGKPRLGRELTVTPGSFDPADAEVSYSWLRSGVAIPGATGTTYQTTPADVGRQLSVRVLLTRVGYRDLTVLLPADGRVTTAPALSLDADGRPGRAVVRLRVTAPGVSAPGGRATVRIGRDQVTGRVVDGRLKVVLDGLAAGTHTVNVSYTGTPVIRSARTTTTVRVPRR